MVMLPVWPLLALPMVMSSTLMLSVLLYVVCGVITPLSMPVATVNVLMSEPGSYGVVMVLLLSAATLFIVLRLDGS